MFCTKCGKNLPDGTKFCTACGEALPQIQAAAQPVPQPVIQPAQPVPQPIPQPVIQPAQPVPQPVPQPVIQPAQPVPQPVPQPIPQPVYRPAPQPAFQPASPVRPPVHYSLMPKVLDVDAPSLSALKSLIRSPITIIAVLVMIAQLMLSIMTALSSFDDLWELTWMLDLDISRSALETCYYGLMVFASALPVLTIISLAVCIGCACVKRGLHTAGITMAKALNYVSLVGIIGAFTAVLVGLIVLTVNIPVGAPWEFPVGEYYIVLDNALPIAIGGIVATVLLAALDIFLQIRAINMLSAAAEIARTEKTTKKASVVLAVVCIFNAVFMGVVAAAMFVWEFLAEMLEIVPEEFVISLAPQAWPVLLLSVAFLLFGVLIFEYRSKVQPLAWTHKEKKHKKSDTQPATTPVLDVFNPVFEEPVQAKPAPEPVVQKPEESALEEPAEVPAFGMPALDEPTPEPEPAEPVAEDREPTVTVCDACGHQILAGTKFCTNCGKAQ